MSSAVASERTDRNREHELPPMLYCSRRRRAATYTADVHPEASYICDSCGEEIEVPVDLSAGRRQDYVEDCPVCCNPNVIHVDVDDEGRPRIWSEPEQDR